MMSYRTQGLMKSQKLISVQEFKIVLNFHVGPTFM